MLFIADAACKEIWSQFFFSSIALFRYEGLAPVPFQCFSVLIFFLADARKNFRFNVVTNFTISSVIICTSRLSRIYHQQGSQMMVRAIYEKSDLKLK